MRPIFNYVPLVRENIFFSLVLDKNIDKNGLGTVLEKNEFFPFTRYTKAKLIATSFGFIGLGGRKMPIQICRNSIKGFSQLGGLVYVF